MASPFYPNVYGLLGAKQNEYETARDKKVKEIIALSSRIVDVAATLKPGIDSLSGKFLKYVHTLAVADSRTQAFAGMTTDQTSVFQTKYSLLKAQYQALLDQSASVGVVQSYVDYMRVMKAVEIGSATLLQLDDVALWAAWALRDMASSKDAAIVEASKSLDGDRASMDALKNDVLALEDLMRGVYYGFGQLYSGDYFLASYVAKYIAGAVPDIKAKAQALRPTELVQADIIEFIKAYAGFFEKVGQDIDALLKQADEDNLTIATYPDSQPGVVYAAGNEDYGKAVSAVAPAIPPTTTQSQGYLAKGWSGVKYVFNESKNAVGAVVDTVSTAAYATARVGYAAETGIFGKTPELGDKALEKARHENEEDRLLAKTRVSSIKDLADDLEISFIETRRNYERGVAGSKVFRTADEYLDAVENNVGGAFEETTEAIVGEGNTSYIAGRIGKITGNMFTSFGRGVSKIANTESTAGEVVEGVMDVTMSLLGGSKTVIKGSQVPGLLKGGAEATYEVAHAGRQVIKTVVVNSEKEAYKVTQKVIVDKGTKKIVQTVVADDIETLAVQESKRVLEQTNKTIVDNLTRVVKEGTETLVKNVTTELPNTIQDVFVKNFTLSLGGVAKAIGTVTGTSLKEYADNLFGNWLDDQIKALTRNTIDYSSAASTATAGSPVAGNPEASTVSSFPTAGRLRFAGDTTYIDIQNFGLPFITINFNNGVIASSGTWSGTVPKSAKLYARGYQQGGKSKSVEIASDEWRIKCALKVTGKILNGQVTGTYVWESVNDIYGVTPNGATVYLQRTTFKSAGNLISSGLRPDGTVDLFFSSPVTQVIEGKLGDAQLPIDGDTLPDLGGYKYVVER